MRFSRKTIKTFIYVLFLLIMGLAMVAGQAAAKDAKVTIRYAHSAPGGTYESIESAWGNVFKAVLEAETNGEVQVNMYPSGQLGDQNVVTDSIQMGTIEMASVAVGALAPYYPKSVIFSIPFAFDKFEDVIEFYKTPLVKQWAIECAEQTKILPVSIQTYGFRNIINNRRVVKSLADMSGLKIRVMTDPVYIKMMEAMGAIPTPLPPLEVYGALQTGVIDGAENTPAVVVMNSWYEVCKYMTRIDYMAGTQATIVNYNFYNSLSPEYKEAFQIAIDAADKAGLGFAYMANYGQALTFLNEKMDIYFLSQPERKEFISLLQPVALEIIGQEIGKEYLARVLQEIENVKSR